LVPADDAETLVVQCLLRNKNKIVSYKHAGQNSDLDKKGIDIVIEKIIKKFKRPISLDFQIKTSDDETTIGVILPLPDPLPAALAGRLSGRKLGIIEKHRKKHSQVPCILFVGRITGRNKLNKVLDEIWREINKLFRMAAWREFRSKFQ
jgi:hypothetical protein